jgi:PAS domain S-box-containing protein
MVRILDEFTITSSGLSVFILDEDDRVIECSPAAGQILCFSQEEILGRAVTDLLPQLQIGTVLEHQLRSEVPGSPVSITVTNGDSRELSLAINALRWTDSAGKRLTTLLFRDLTQERDLARMAHNRLVQSDNAIQGANIGVFEYDLNTLTVKVSDIWRRILELDPDEQLDVQEEWRSRVHPDDLEAALEPVRICSAGKIERASCEYRLYSRDRSRLRWMRTDIAVARRDLALRPRLLVGAQTDITEQKSTEEALRISVAQFRSAFDHAPIGKAIIDLNGKHQLVNPAMCAVLGYTEDELLAINFQSLTHPDDLEADLARLQSLIEGGIRSYTIDKRYYRANGAIMWGRFTVGMIRNNDGRPDHFIYQVVDITEQRRLDELKNEFVSIVSHELRTPLTSILGALSLLEVGEEMEASDEMQRLVFIAKTNGERLHSLINSILDFQKFSAKEMSFSFSPHGIAVLVEEAVITGLVPAEKYGIKFNVQITDRSLVGILDPTRFHQVMSNLLSNATKFADAGSVIDVSTELVDSFIRVSITNKGPGIPDDFRERLFKPFSQGTSVSGRNLVGTGLGLSITKQIVEQMGGEIGYENKPDNTTTFWFTVRAAGKDDRGVHRSWPHPSLS